MLGNCLSVLNAWQGIATTAFLLIAGIGLSCPNPSHAAPGTECDVLASSLYQRIAFRPEIVDDDLDISKAEAACRAALTEYPGVPRLQAILARVLLVKVTRDGPPTNGLDDPTLSEALSLSQEAASVYSEMGDALTAEILLRFGKTEYPAATAHILKAIDNGSHLAIYRMAEWLGQEDIAAKLDSDRLQAWIEKGVEENKYYAKIVLGSCAWSGLLCDRDIGHAKRLFTEVAQQHRKLVGAFLRACVLLEEKEFFLGEPETYAEDLEDAMRYFSGTHEKTSRWVPLYFHPIHYLLESYAEIPVFGNTVREFATRAYVLRWLAVRVKENDPRAFFNAAKFAAYGYTIKDQYDQKIPAKKWLTYAGRLGEPEANSILRHAWNRDVTKADFKMISGCRISDLFKKPVIAEKPTSNSQPKTETDR